MNKRVLISQLAGMSQNVQVLILQRLFLQILEVLVVPLGNLSV
jgi:hypothetical protein